MLDAARAPRLGLCRRILDGARCALRALALVALAGVATFDSACSDGSLRVAERKAVEEFTRKRDALIAVGQWVGAANTEHFVVEFGDYECPACRYSSAVVDSIVQGPDSVAVLFISLPLPSHQAAYPAALAALCADEQHRGSQMHSLLMTEWSWQANRDWGALAMRAGVTDSSRFAKCLTASSTIARLERGIDLANGMNVIATPTLIGPLGAHVGVPTRADVRALLTGS